METVTLTIDGQAVTVEKGKTILQAAIEHGIAIPFYCYHPGIGIEGSCRVCVVKVEKMPKLQTSCSTACAEGMVVQTCTPEVEQARAGVFEFLLVNHPLDCPVCDKGGECPLQDFSYRFGPDASRVEFERRVFDGRGVEGDVEFGPTLMLNRQRCILCTRCVRFMRHIDGDAQIGIIDRGYGSQIATFQEEGVRSILSGNLMDICPVGAITTRDYRFKSRPWNNPSAVDTICTLCAKGCSVTAWIKGMPEWAKGNRLVRFTPRLDPEVNGYWMCDIGRFEYHWIEGDDRLRRPLVRGLEGALVPASWNELMAALGSRLESAAAAGGVRFLVSAHASHEELFLVGRLAAGIEGIGRHRERPSGGTAPAAEPITDAGPAGRADGHGTPRAADSDGAAPAAITISWRYRPKAQPANTRFTVPAVDAPNVNGARLMGVIDGRVGDEVGEADLSALQSAVEAGRVSALYVLDPGPEGSLGEASWIVEARRRGTLPLLVVQGVVFSELARAADFVLPGASYVEKEASYTNEQGRLQGTARAVAPPGDALDDWRVLVNLGAALGVPLEYASTAEVRAGIAARYAGSELDRVGALTFGQAAPARDWLQGSNPAERWKWDVMFQDLPPVKGAVDPTALPLPPGTIRLNDVTQRVK